MNCCIRSRLRLARVTTPLLLAMLGTQAFAQTEPDTAPVVSAVVLGPVLNVSNLDRSLRFYLAGLGMSLNHQMGPPERRESILGFGADPSKPGIILMSAAGQGGAKITHGDGYERLVLRMVDLPAAVARLRAAGFQPSDVREVAMGYRMAMVSDPDGHQYELVESAGKQEKAQ